MKHFIVRKPTLTNCFLLIIYYVIMELYYYYFVGVSYDRFGFNVDINWNKYVETKIIFILLVGYSLFISRLSEFIYSVFTLFIIFFLVPALITYSFSDRVSAPLYFTVALMVFLGIISVNRIHIPVVQSMNFSYGLIAACVIFLLVPMVYTFGMYFDVSNLIFRNIHITRDQFDENSSGVLNYLYNWLVKAIIPVTIVFFLIHKRYMYALITLFILFYLYVISGNKIVFITLFIMLFFYMAGKDHVEKIRYFTIATIIGLLIIPLVDHYVLHSHSFKGIFVMRMLFFPSQLNYFYFDFFREQPLYFAESNFFKMFVTYPYDKPIGFIISETYFNAPDMNANNGIISDGYMNLGYLGVGLNILIVTGVFLFFNSVNIDSRYLGIFVVMIFMFLSAPMLSMFITSGLWILFIMALTFMRENEILIKS